MLEKPYEVFFEVWVFEHPQVWSRFKDNPQNRTTIIAAASKYPLCCATFDRALFDSKDQLVRTDGHDEDWDIEQDSKRRALWESERDASTDNAFLEYINSLSQVQLAKIYYADTSSEFARKYRVCARDLGYSIPACPFIIRGSQAKGGV